MKRLQVHRRLVALLCFSLVLCFPFKITVLPEWKVKVVDADGRQVAGAKVNQSWNHFTLGFDGGVERWTNADGYVVLPEQTIRASILRRIVFSILAAIPIPWSHASAGFRASVWAVIKDNSSEIIDINLQKPLPEEIALRR